MRLRRSKEGGSGRRSGWSQYRSFTFVQPLNRCLDFISWYLLLIFCHSVFPQLQLFVVAVLKVILANLNPLPVQPPLPPPPPSSRQVLFADKEGKQGVGKLVRSRHGTKECIDSESNGQRVFITMDPATGRAEAVPGVGRANGEGGGGTKRY